MSAPRGLSADEAAAWARLAVTVTPLAGKAHPRNGERDRPKGDGGDSPSAPPPISLRPKAIVTGRTSPPTVAVRRPHPRSGDEIGLDSHWARKFDAGTVSPDFTLDLHGATLDTAYDRLMHGMAQAQAIGARVVLVVTGKPRPADPADRAHRRGAIRAKILDWLAASSHGPAIAEVRQAHRRHGGEGALYLVLRRRG